VNGPPTWWINSEMCAEQPLHSCYRDELRKLHDAEYLLLWSHRFATWSALAAAAAAVGNTSPCQLQKNFENFPNICCIYLVIVGSQVTSL
jgi:hypothetical protein